MDLATRIIELTPNGPRTVTQRPTPIRLFLFSS